MSKSGNPKNASKKNKETPYSRATRSGSRKKDSPPEPTCSNQMQVDDSTPAVELLSDDDRPGPSWSEFDKLKSTVNEMHDLLKSFKDQSGSQSLSIDINDKVATPELVDNHIIPRPREAGDLFVVGNNDVQQPSTSGTNPIDHSSVNEYLRSFVHSGTGNNQGEHQYFQPGRPIDLKVNEKIRQKIWSDQFIDLATLLDPQVHSEIGITITGDPGEPLKFTPTKSNRTIGNLGQWCSAFEIFIIIYCQKKPHELSPLMSYMNSIKTLSHKGGDYFTYDREFRYMRQTITIPWDSVHSGLWLECRDKNPKSNNKSKSSSNQDNFRPKSQQNKGKQHPFGYCFRYHSFGKCGRNACKFKHSCYGCNDEAHPYSKCPKNPNSVNTDSTN